MQDLDIALGHDYQLPGHHLFPEFSPQYQASDMDDSPLFEKLNYAYQSLEASRQSDARTLVQNALSLCASSPQGLRRSLVCVDLAHKIVPEFGSEKLHSSLLLRPTDEAECALWVWQLVRRWHKWNIQVISNSQDWEKAINIVILKGIYEVLIYYYRQNSRSDYQCWKNLTRIALGRIEREEAAFFDIGYDPEKLRDNIDNLIRSIDRVGTQQGEAMSLKSNDDIIKLLWDQLPKKLKNLGPSELLDETGWVTDLGFQYAT